MRARTALLVGLGVLAPGVARAGAWTVPGSYSTIAETLAVANDWDSILVIAAEYGGEPPVTVTGNVSILSADGSPVAYPQFVVLDATLRLSDGYISGVEETNPDGVSRYDGIYVSSGEVDLTRVDLLGGYDHGVYAIDSTLWIEDSDFIGFVYSPALEVDGGAEDTTTGIDGGAFTDNAAGGVHVFNVVDGRFAWVGLTEVTFARNSTFEYGGDARFVQVDLAEFDGGSSDDAYAGSGGGSIAVLDSNLRVTGTRFTNATAAHGGAIFAVNQTSSHTVDLTEATFDGCVADEPKSGAGGGLYLDGVDTNATDLVVTGCEADFGGFAYLLAGTLVLYDGSITGSTASYGGGVKVAGGTARVLGTAICANDAVLGGGIYAEYGEVEVDGAVLQLNTASTGGALASYDATVTVLDTTMVGNQADDAAIATDSSLVYLVNDIFAGSPTGLRTSNDTVTAGYNLYWELDTLDSGYATLPGDVNDDPRFVKTFDPDACGTEPALQEISPAIDVGYPHWFDDDASRSDIGAYDFVHSTDDTGVVVDDTGTVPVDDTGGVPTDDTAPVGDDTAAPDADGDGTPDAEDCGPGDPAIHPGATDDPFDDIDQDCDGTAATGLAHGGCDCDSGGGAGGGLLLVGWMITRRRRSG